MTIPQKQPGTVGALLLAALLFLAPSHPQAQQATEGFRKVVVKTQVLYPSLARSMMIQGSVRVEALVAPDGTVKSVEVKGGHPILAESALTAVRRWKFEPAPHESREVIEIKFDPSAL